MNQFMTPREGGYYQPAEWAFHQSCWLAWPSDSTLWKEDLEAAQQEFVALCAKIADIDPVTGLARGESLEILVPDPVSQSQAVTALRGLPVRFHSIPFGDIWLRDTAPLFLVKSLVNGEASGRASIATVKFKFNGWGGKYVLPFDDQVSEKISNAAGVKSFSFPWILEGGSIEVDGEGTCLTSQQCLLNKNRNADLSQSQVESGLCDALGVSKVLWLRDGLLNDHTDGHIDTIARFVAPGVVACMKSVDPSQDPNHAVMEEIAADLESFTDARGRRLKVVRIPSPGRVLSGDDRIMPASYLNFYIGNTTVVVPTYGSEQDENAVKAIAQLFPGRTTVGSSAIAILTGGGAFHCITQQQPGSTND